MHDWIVVGGGIHGVTCASFLRENGVETDKLAIVDPLPHLLTSWKRSTEAVGVEQLRSTHVHHIAQDPYSLIHFARTREGKQLGKLRGKYGHPDLNLFNTHSDRVVEKLSLERSHIHDRAIGLENEEGVWKVLRQKGSTLYSRNVVLALGCEQSLPDWFCGELLNDQRVQVGFEAHPLPLENDQRILIIGSGMSGVQLALQQASIYPGRVTLLSRRAPVRSLFDSAPGWHGPKYQEPFRKIVSYKSRRERIRNARIPGSVPPHLLSSFKKRVREESLSFLQGALEGVISGPEELRAIVSTGSADSCIDYRFHQIILATGFSNQCPQKELIEQIARQHDLPLSSCGFPIPQTRSHWGKGLHLSGAHAELEVGPVARNIIGARIAAESLSDEPSRT